MEVRKVRPDDDFVAIGEIYAQSWKTAYRGIVPQEHLDRLNASRWAHRLAENRHDFYVVMNGKAFVGVSSVSAARDEKMTNWGEIGSIYLLPEYFGKGYAGPLLERAVNALGEKGFTDVYLWVLAENLRAHKFYEKHGFQKNDDVAQLTIAGKVLTIVRYIKQRSHEAL